MNSVPPASLAFPVIIQRNSFGPRLAPHAGDVWRAMQDVVVDESSSVGWTPERYVEANTMFVVRTMTVKHEREVKIGEELVGRTWPSRARRQMLFTRQVRLFSKATQPELIASATQEWAYLSRDLEPIRAGKDIFDAFTIVEGHPDVELPSFVAEANQKQHVFDFTTWYGWMDPHGHANHAAYVDYCDEGISRVVAEEGGNPHGLVPVAETVHFRAAIGPAALITVETTKAGHSHGGSVHVYKHRILTGEQVCATATTLRRLT
ncbi:MAG: hotdog domain-containing protein [Archangium sp.]